MSYHSLLLQLFVTQSPFSHRPSPRHITPCLTFYPHFSITPCLTIHSSSSYLSPNHPFPTLFTISPHVSPFTPIFQSPHVLPCTPPPPAICHTITFFPPSSSSPYHPMSYHSFLLQLFVTQSPFSHLPPPPHHITPCLTLYPHLSITPCLTMHSSSSYL